MEGKVNPIKISNLSRVLKCEGNERDLQIQKKTGEKRDLRLVLL